eukprot:scaffold345742_cov31-Attheya_sp.AAC.1
MDMGFTYNGCARALTKVRGTDIEAAMGWIFEHSQDPDLNDPLPATSTADAPTTESSGVDEGVVASLVDNLGCFTSDQVRAALKETGGAADRAADWLFSHMDDLDGAIAALESKASSGGGGGRDTTSGSRPLEDGTGKYTL